MKLYCMLVHVSNDMKSKTYHSCQNLAPEKEIIFDILYVYTWHLGPVCGDIQCRNNYNMWPGLGKQVLSTQNTHVWIMVHISFSVYAIYNLLVLLNSSWICAYTMTFYVHYGLQIKIYYILNSQNQVKFYT